MNVLVVGGTGFVGTHLCREFAARGHQVTALSRHPDDADLPPEVDRVAGDSTAYDSIEGAFEGQDAVVFLVSLSPLFKPKGGYERHFDVHLGGTENAVRAAREHGVEKYVQMSALGADPNGDTAYIRAKGQADEVVKSSGLDWTVFRPSVIFGEGDEFVGFTKRIAPPYLTPLPGGGKSEFQPLWVGDLAEMFSMVVEGRLPDGERGDDSTSAGQRVAGDGSGGREEAGEGDGVKSPDPHVGQVYEVGGPAVLTMAEVARLAHAADGRPTNVYPLPMALAGVGLAVLDRIPGVPLGEDQYRSLKFDNVTAHNDAGVFGFEASDLRSLADYLGVDSAAARTGRA